MFHSRNSAFKKIVWKLNPDNPVIVPGQLNSGLDAEHAGGAPVPPRFFSEQARLKIVIPANAPTPCADGFIVL